MQVHIFGVGAKKDCILIVNGISCVILGIQILLLHFREGSIVKVYKWSFLSKNRVWN